MYQSMEDNMRQEWLVKVYKMEIMKRDKKMETKEKEGGAAWLLLPLNIIPKKSPSSPSPVDPALPVLLAPVTVPPPLNPGNRSPLSLHTSK